MKISLTGSQGTGKTTLCEAFINKYPKFYYLKETARIEIKKAGKLPQFMTLDERCAFQERVLDSQIEQELANPSFISDRSVFDVLAYTKGLPNYNRLKEKALKHYLKNKYDVVFYVPIQFDIEGDSERDPDKKYQQEIDENIMDLIKEFKLPVKIVQGTVDERLATMTNLLQWWAGH